jgi:hypothetical protein
MDTMTFTQWLQFIFIPRVHQILDENGVFPTSSMVGTQALREFDGDERASKLVNLLIEFDQLFSGHKGSISDGMSRPTQRAAKYFSGFKFFLLPSRIHAHPSASTANRWAVQTSSES